ncbi:MAG: calcium-binding protein [Waterburya sp.]
MATGTITIQSDDSQNFRIANDQVGVEVTGTNGADIINGSDGNDKLIALAGNDTIFGSLGQDTVDGGAGRDTIDYSSVNGTVTLFPQGLLNNGDPQNSQLINMETIIASSGRPNVIDASAVTTDLGATLDINLGTNKLTVKKIPQLGTQNFTVQNFVNVSGTQNQDIIVGNSQANDINGNDGNDALTGSGGNDIITGGGGNDTLSGTDSSVRGLGELDTLQGGIGTDRFVLGDRSGAFYATQGNGDFAKINDFEAGDQIQLGVGDTYQVVRGSGNFQLFVTTGDTNDLIADVTFGSTSASNARVSSSTDILTEVPEGDFSVDSGEELGIFVG